MRRLVARRLRGVDDEGVYAILYAVLAVVLVAMAAIVVDFAEVRQHRRLDRSATDAAAIAGAPYLNNQSGTGASAKQACLSSWKYLALTLRVTQPAAACTAFNAYDTAATVAAYCSTASPPVEITDVRTVSVPGGSGDVTVKVAWPIPYHPGGAISEFLTPELAPGSANQTFSTTVDGTDAGCERLGVAILQQEKFGLGGAIGASGTQTQVHSVARFDASAGPLKSVAALNILNINECNALDDSGGGNVVVDPVVRGNTIVGPGSIAVESSGTANSADWVSNCQGSKTVISVSGSGKVCASSVLITSTVACDGLGIVQLHEMDDGVNNNGSQPSTSNTCPNDQLCPVPKAENGTYRWNPVTEIYGCNTSVLNPCAVPATNYVAALEAAYGGNGTPTGYTAAAPYPNPYAGAGWTTISGAGCNVSGTPAPLPAGNYYFNCNGLSVTGTLIIGGGNVVLKSGDLTIGNSGCFVFNSAITLASAVGSCGSLRTNGSITGTGTRITTNPAPTHDAILYLRGGSIDTSGTMVMPQVFTYSKASRLNIGGGPFTLWTAPGAGALNGVRTTLQQDCFDSAAGATSDSCMASRFSRLVYWSDAKAVAGGNTENKFVAQGTLNLVGVFFTPRGSFHFGGGNCLAATSAQYWADDLTVEGGACVTLKPDAEFSEERPSGLVQLIR